MAWELRFSPPLPVPLPWQGSHVVGTPILPMLNGSVLNGTFHRQGCPDVTQRSVHDRTQSPVLDGTLRQAFSAAHAQVFHAWAGSSSALMGMLRCGRNYRGLGRGLPAHVLRTHGPAGDAQVWGSGGGSSSAPHREFRQGRNLEPAESLRIPSSWQCSAWNGTPPREGGKLPHICKSLIILA